MEYIIERIDDSTGPEREPKVIKVMSNPAQSEQWSRQKNSMLKSLWEDNWR